MFVDLKLLVAFSAAGCESWSEARNELELDYRSNPGHERFLLWYSLKATGFTMNEPTSSIRPPTGDSIATKTYQDLPELAKRHGHVETWW